MARSEERAVIAVGLAIVIVAPFSFAQYGTEAKGYELPDAAALTSITAWSEARLLPGAAILAPVREAKWIEGLTGRSALFSSDVRYAFRSVEWDRSLAAAAILRGNLALANEDFVLTMTDGVPAPFGQEPQGLIVAANHGGEPIELLRLAATGTTILGGPGGTPLSVPALAPAGFQHVASAERLVASTYWSSTRQAVTPALVSTISLDSGASTFELDVRADPNLGQARIQLALDPAQGVILASLDPVGTGGSASVAADLTFSRVGRSQPQLRLTLAGGGTISRDPTGGVMVTSSGRDLALSVSDLTAGGASSSLRLLDPAQLVADYDVGAVVLRQDTTYPGRRDRLQLLGFHVAEADGPYIVMARTAAVTPAGSQ